MATSDARSNVFYAVVAALLMATLAGARDLDRPRFHRPRSRNSELRTTVAHACHDFKRRVTFSLPATESAGGFGDRLLGLTTTFYLAVMTSSRLDVNWTRPYNLRDYFRVVDCVFVEDAVRSMAGAVETRARNVHDNRGAATRASPRHGPQPRHRPQPRHGPQPAVPAHTVHAIDEWSYFESGAFLKDVDADITVMTNSRHWVDLVTHAALTERAARLGLAGLTRKQLFKRAVDALLVPRHKVVDAASSVLARLAAVAAGAGGWPPFYVGVQIRCGSHGSLSWEDPTRHSLADVPCFVEEALRACGDRSVCPIFLTADSRTATDAFRDALTQRAGAHRTGVVEFEGPILHTDRTSAKAATMTGLPDPWLRSVVDWWILKQATALVISRSGFGETAAWAASANARRVQLAPPGACVVTDFY